jgi:hypothetical protein
VPAGPMLFLGLGYCFVGYTTLGLSALLTTSTHAFSRRAECRIDLSIFVICFPMSMFVWLQRGRGLKIPYWERLLADSMCVRLSGFTRHIFLVYACSIYISRLVVCMVWCHEDWVPFSMDMVNSKGI